MHKIVANFKNFSIEGGENISEEYALEIVEAYSEQYTKIPYRPLSDRYDFLMS